MEIAGSELPALNAPKGSGPSPGERAWPWLNSSVNLIMAKIFRLRVWLFSRWLILPALFFFGFSNQSARAVDDDYISRDADDEKSQLPEGQRKLAAKFANVVAWEGSFHRETSGAKRGGEGPDYWSSEFDSAASGTFRLRQHIVWEKRGTFEWVGDGEISGHIGFQHSEFDQTGHGYEEGGRVSVKPTKMTSVEFSVYIDRGFALLSAGDVDDPEIHVAGRAVSYFAKGGSTPGKFPHQIDEMRKFKLVTFPQPELGQAARWAIVGGGPGPYIFASHRDEGGGAESTTSTLVEMHPVYEDVEVELTAKGYKAWRPLGNLDSPTKPGAALALRATLKPAKPSAKPTALPLIKRFRFELLRTSREPGVCLNWPLEAKDNDYDLRLAGQTFLAENQPFVPGAEISDGGQTAFVTHASTNDRGEKFGDVVIESYDFGGRAEIRVICELEDGRQVVGKMKGAPNETLVPFPRRQAGHWIAQSWRDEHEANELSDLDDDEKVEGQEEKGDGFTLYEEYRGWCVDGKHVEGDAKKKDFFVLNFIGPNAQPGIDLFKALSQLIVHDHLRDSEMSRQARLMNGNHRAAPHHVDQHGVWIDQFVDDPETQVGGLKGVQKLGVTGAATPLTKSGVAGRPGITIGIGLLARENPASDFNKAYNLAPSDAAFAYDRAIAHELLHSVGVDHHGSGDYLEALTFVSPNHPLNNLGRPFFRRTDTTQVKPVTLVNEAGEDLALAAMTEYPRIRAFVEAAYHDEFLKKNRELVAQREGIKLMFSTPEEWTNYELEEAVGFYLRRSGIVGVQQGPDSGEQDCIMRYYFADFYQSLTERGALYHIAPGTEPIGFDICHLATGTGINAADRKPQSRYGDTHENLGNCFAYICPNDAIPPRKTPK